MALSPLEKKITDAITPITEDMGYEIVRVQISGSGRQTVQILAEDADGKMGVEDCKRLSQAVSTVIDVENILSGAYVLEVSSPGIDRPLTRLKDFIKYIGFEARIELTEGTEGQKRFKGILKGANGDDITLETEMGDVTLPFPDIQKAKLVLTDELLKSAQKQNAG